jgi:hypothetical protein
MKCVIIVLVGISCKCIHWLSAMVDTNINFLYLQKVKIMTCSFQNWSFNWFFIQCLHTVYICESQYFRSGKGKSSIPLFIVD